MWAISEDKLHINRNRNGEMKMNEMEKTVCIVPYTHPQVISDADISSFLNKAFHCVPTTFPSCSVQRSPLNEKNITTIIIRIRQQLQYHKCRSTSAFKVVIFKTSVCGFINF